MRHVVRRLHRLLRRVRRRVEPGDRVDRPHQREQRHRPEAARRRPDAAARRAAVVGEGEQAAELERRRAVQHRDRQQQRDDEDQPAAEVGEQRRHADPEVVQQRVRQRDQRDARDLVARAEVRRIDPEHRPDEPHEQVVRADVDGGGDEHEARQVEPGGRPAPPLAAEDRAPVIEPAGGRKRGRDLGHAQRDDQRERDADAARRCRPRRRRPRETPSWNEVMPPARMQMVENEIAKFENAPMRRRSSCA